MAETIGRRILRLRNSKAWSRPELGRQLANATGKKKPYSGEAVRRWEENIDQPGREARAAIAKLFERSESYIEFGDQPQATRANEARQTAAQYVSDEALAIARAFDQMQPQSREFIREQVFIYTIIDQSFPWLRRGRPVGTSYEDFERWHQENIAQVMRKGATSKREKTK
jgi:transcriptional regulator with XRE-family HTH domain